MKKIYLIAFTVLATLALGSCVQEIQDDNTSNVALADNGIAFVMKGGTATRADEGTAIVSKGVTIPLGKTEDGTSLYLEETVTNLDAVAPITRGTPAYTENLGVLYAGQLGVHASAGSFGEYSFENDSQASADGSWRYFHVYDSDPWPDETTSVKFYLRMPAVMNGLSKTVDGETATYDPLYGGTSGTDETITITYYSPATAANMQDILFGYTSMKKPEYKTLQAQGGAHVTLYHALTGVKFRIGNTDDEIDADDITIDEICFVGLKDNGTCTINASGDNVTSATAAVWSSLGVTEGAVLSSEAYGDLVTYATDGSFGDAGAYASSFAAGDNDKNLNKADGSQTFWLIPQEMTNAVKLKITYTFDGHQTTGYLDFGKALAGVTWQAGELRTYTIRVQDVNVQIDDQVTIPSTATEDNGYSGSTKSNVTIKNTGNTDAFIRAAIVGQWLDPDGNPVFGFTDKVNNLYLVESWYENQFVNETTDEEELHGRFTGLPGYKGAASFKAEEGDPTAGWQLCEDGYYYYTKAVAPDAYTGSPLFNTYVTLKAPKAELAGRVLETAQMHFVLEISTQAISAIQRTGASYTSWKAAWQNALGSAPVEK